MDQLTDKQIAEGVRLLSADHDKLRHRLAQAEREHGETHERLKQVEDLKTVQAERDALSASVRMGEVIKLKRDLEESQSFAKRLIAAHRQQSMSAEIAHRDLALVRPVLEAARAVAETDLNQKHAMVNDINALIRAVRAMDDYISGRRR